MQKLTEGTEVHIEASATVSSGSYAPLWLTSNRWGKNSPYANSAYTLVGLERSMQNDSTKRWRKEYGADLQISINGINSFFIHQLYAGLGFGHGAITIGQKEQHLELKNDHLSSGSQTFGINARPIPEVRLALDRYWAIPIGGRWVSLKGYMSFGKYTDGNWQKEFTNNAAALWSKYSQGILSHSKAGYVKIEKPNSPLTIQLGLEMETQFGGTTYTNKNLPELIVSKGETGLKAIWHALTFGGADAGEGLYANNGGNTLGSYVARIDYRTKDATISIYGDHFFEDHSQMFFIDFDGYGTGDKYNEWVSDRWLIYELKDIMLGTEVKLNHQWWVDNVLVEYLYTKHQSGPINHDRTPEIGDHVAGNDNYYNNYIYPGWQNYGLVLGNPLYRSPIYNEDGNIRIENNRFQALHFGCSGQLTPTLRYRVLSTIQKGWGTYTIPYSNPKSHFSLLLEANWLPEKIFGSTGWKMSGAVAYDRSEILNNSVGIQMNLRKTFDL